MKQRLRIPVSLVEQHINDICFLVYIDFTYIQAAIPPVRWLRPLGYEINIDEASAAIIALLAKDIDKSEKPFGTFDVVKSKVEMELKTASTLKEKDRLVKKLKEIFGEGAAEEDEEEEEEEQGQGPLALTQSMGEDTEEAKGVEEEQTNEAPKVEAKKRKAQK